VGLSPALFSFHAGVVMVKPRKEDGKPPDERAEESHAERTSRTSRIEPLVPARRKGPFGAGLPFVTPSGRYTGLPLIHVPPEDLDGFPILPDVDPSTREAVTKFREVKASGVYTSVTVNGTTALGTRPETSPDEPIRSAARVARTSTSSGVRGGDAEATARPAEYDARRKKYPCFFLPGTSFFPVRRCGCATVVVMCLCYLARFCSGKNLAGEGYMTSDAAGGPPGGIISR
jgi:hypothetical protein